jgi:hypothetical protein
MKKIWLIGILVGIMATAALAGGPNHHKNPVPEPVSMIALGAGAITLIARRKKA